LSKQKQSNQMEGLMLWKSNTRLPKW